MSITTIAEAQAKIAAVKENIKKVIIENDTALDNVLTALFSGGHILLEDAPGTGKTSLAKALAKTISGGFSRIQFTPDLLPSDITGLNIYNKQEESFKFIEGPIMTEILLADEINRATPRTQSALLEAMQEGQVTVDGVTRRLSDVFFVIATQNPIETAGTFPLPEAQLDRFTMLLSLGYPTEEGEINLLKRFNGQDPLSLLTPVITIDEILEIIELIKKVKLHEDLVKYIVSLVRATRNNSEILLGASPRAALSLQEAAKARAVICGRDYVTPEDIKELAPHVLTHRMLFYSSVNHTQKIGAFRRLLNQLEVPGEDFNNK